MANSSDNRAATRMRVDVSATYSDGNTTLRGSVDDVSRSGLFLRADRAGRPGHPEDEALGTVGTVDLTMPDTEESIQLKAEVVREHGGRGGLGIRFLDSSREARRCLADYLLRCAFREQH